MSKVIEKWDTRSIYVDIYNRLVTGRFEQGQKLKSEEIKRIYGCSAATIREVLHRLATDGLVKFEEQRGFRARPVNLERKRDLTRFRIMLEQEGMALSLQNGDIEWEAQLSAAHHKLSHIEGQIRKTNEIGPLLMVWSNAEWEFHDALIAACGSPILRETYKTVYNQFRQQHVTKDTNYGFYVNNIKEHQGILEAALARDEAMCRVRIYDHLSRNLTE